MINAISEGKMQNGKVSKINSTQIREGKDYGLSKNMINFETKKIPCDNSLDFPDHIS